MYKSCSVIFTLILFLFTLALTPSQSGILESLEISMAPWNSLTGPFNNTSQYGVALLNINGQTNQPQLGGIESGAFGNFVYLAVNDLVGGVTASRMIKFPKLGLDDLNLNRDEVDGTLDDGFVFEATATSQSGAEFYLTNGDLEFDASDNPNDHSGDTILGMTVDTSSNDIYAVVQNTTMGNRAIMRLSQGDTTVQNVIEFAAPTTMPQPLSPGFSPLFDEVMMGPESVAFFRQEDATDVFFFTDGTAIDFCISWAVQDLPFQRTESGGNAVNTSIPDTNFYTDEMRVHANVIASGRAFDDVSSPHIYSDAVLVDAFETIAFCTGRTLDESLFVVDDLNDNEEHVSGDPDFPQVDTVIDNRTPTALCNVFDVGEFDSNRDILLADYDEGTDTTEIVKVHFNTKETVTETVLDLWTKDAVLPGRITGLAMDINGNIYAVDGELGCVFLIRERIDVEFPEIDPTFRCFRTDLTGDFTLDQLVAAINAEATNVVTELRLFEDGNLGAFAPIQSVTRHFYYFNQPVSIPRGSHLLVDNGEYLIFRSDGADRAYLDVFGQIRTVAENPVGFTSVGLISNELEEAEVRYTSAIGFISWLKTHGVETYADLGWAAPIDDTAALAFQAFANRPAPFSALSIYDLVHSSTTTSLDLTFAVGPREYETITETRVRVLNDEIAMENLFGAGVGRWGGIWFGDSEVGNGVNTTSSIQHSVIEFAEVGIYDLDDRLSPSSPRDENHLRIVENLLQGNLIGISIDGASPLVARNTIRFSAVETAFDDRSFGGSRPFIDPCKINRLTQRFAPGDSGTGVFITKRDAGPITPDPVDTEPLFFSNRIRGNAVVGVVVQQPGVSEFPGTPTNSRIPRPLFGSVEIPARMAHEFINAGRNQFFENGLPGLRRNFVYNVEELPSDFGVASIDHPLDIEVQFAFWGEVTIEAIENTLIDGRQNSELGEVIIDNAVSTEITSVEGSTELYK